MPQRERVLICCTTTSTARNHLASLEIFAVLIELRPMINSNLSFEV